MAVESLLTIGRLASQADVNVQTIRYYERCGLLAPPERSASGYRQYSADHVRIIRFIKNAQNLGFSLAEIGELLRLRGDSRKSCRHVRDMINAKMADLAKRAAGLRTMHSRLNKLIAACRRQSPASACPIMEALDEGNLSNGNKARAKSARTKAGLAPHLRRQPKDRLRS